MISASQNDRKVSEILQKMLNDYGDTLFCSAEKFLAFFYDLAPDNQKERRLFKLLFQSGADQVLFQARRMERQEQLRAYSIAVKQMNEEQFVRHDMARYICGLYLQAIGGTAIEATDVVDATDYEQICSPVSAEAATVSSSMAISPKPLFKSTGAFIGNMHPFMNDSSPAEYDIENGVLKRFNGDAVSIYVPNGVKEMASYALARSSCRSIVFPSSLEKIPLCAGSKSLTRVALQEGVRGISRGGFWNCNELTEVFLPLSLETVGVQCFWGCTALRNVYYAGTLSDWERIQIDGGNECLLEAKLIENTSCEELIIDRGSFSVIGNKLICYKGNEHRLMVPVGIKEIEANAFSNNETCEEIVIPDGVKHIGKEAFSKCKRLKRIWLPAGINFDKTTFDYCSGLKDIYYKGTPSEWRVLLRWNGNGYLHNASVHYE